MLLVTVGTEQYHFNALMKWVDLLIREGLIDPDEEVIVQYGSSSKLPDKVRIFKRLPESEFKALLEQARVVISHCGEGSVMLLESLGKPYVLVPRTRRFGEHVDDHQLEMADAMEKQDISVARSPGDLVRFLAVPKVSGLILNDEEKLCEFLSNNYDCNKYKKVMLICSSGGHFKYAQSLNPFLEKFQDVCWVTFQISTTESVLKTEKSVYWAHSPTNRNLPNLLRNLILAFKVLKHEQPDLVLSTGAGIAVPFLFLAKFIYKKKTIFIESKTRLRELSLSAKILYYTSSLNEIIVRSKKIAKRYPKTQYIEISSTVLATPEYNNKQPNSMKVNESVSIINTPVYFGVTENNQFKNDFQKLCESGSKKIVIDMSLTRWITSMGLGTLVSNLKTSRARGIELVLWSVSPAVMSILIIAKLNDVFTIEPASLAVRPRNEEKPEQRLEIYSIHKLVQRAIDIGVATLGLCITAILLIPIGIGIKVDSPGSIFSEESCYGLMGKYFRMRKFRSTVTKVVARDCSIHEVTKFGHLLRKTNLDKLPLFWNVLVGDMSLVGPQASMVDALDCYSTTEWKALEVKPGMISKRELHNPCSSCSATPRDSKQNVS